MYHSTGSCKYSFICNMTSRKIVLYKTVKGHFPFVTFKHFTPGQNKQF